jgi:hypothetical protein
MNKRKKRIEFMRTLIYDDKVPKISLLKHCSSAFNEVEEIGISTKCII